MDDPTALDALFREAVSLIGAGDVDALEGLLREHPRLARERLGSPGAWLRDQIGRALDGFFREPYLLWFVAEDPVRNGRLPANIAEVARAIIAVARRGPGTDLREQLDHALLLVAWSRVAHEAGVQLDLLDVLVDAGASPDAGPNNALVNGHVAAAAHLVGRGAPLTLATAACLGRWHDVPRLAETATAGQKQFALVPSALNGQARAVAALLDLGADANAPCGDLYSHGTPLHHAVCSGALDAVTVLVEAGGALNTQDTAFHGTPLGWALHYQGEHAHDDRGPRYAAIAAYLRSRATQAGGST